MSVLWKFTKGPYKGQTALTVDKEKLDDSRRIPKDRDLITLYLNDEIISFSKEALEQIATRVQDRD